uniref:Uncharacterized protein n=1 Tax=Plectus sambesii TaxID=2011161 RepID=A0A914V5T3_9BILA
MDVNPNEFNRFYRKAANVRISEYLVAFDANIGSTNGRCQRRSSVEFQFDTGLLFNNDVHYR